MDTTLVACIVAAVLSIGLIILTATQMPPTRDYTGDDAWPSEVGTSVGVL